MSVLDERTAAHMRQRATLHLQRAVELTPGEVDRLCESLILRWAMDEAAGVEPGRGVIAMMVHPAAGAPRCSYAAVNASGNRSDEMLAMFDDAVRVAEASIVWPEDPDAPEDITARIREALPWYTGRVGMMTHPDEDGVERRWALVYVGGREWSTHYDEIMEAIFGDAIGSGAVFEPWVPVGGWPGMRLTICMDPLPDDEVDAGEG